MENKCVVDAKNITKVYRIYTNDNEKVKDLIFRKSKAEDFYALMGITFKAYGGDSIGLIGFNGSGKTTLANIIGGVSMPTEGSIEINGEVSLISISSGLNPFLTGIENIEVKGLMIGLTMKQINDLKESIIEFADLGAFINQPVKMYSSGMKARLGFAIAVNISPDILVIDEALSVGDQIFTQKCLDKMEEFRSSGKTIFFVSHSPQQISSFCNKAIWLEYGVLKAFGPVEEVLPMYERFLSSYNKMTKEEKKEYQQKVVQNYNHLLLRGKN